MNGEFKRYNLYKKIRKDSANIYLKVESPNPRQLWKVFHLKKNKKEEREEFCKRMLDVDMSEKQIMFIDENQIKT